MYKNTDGGEILISQSVHNDIAAVRSTAIANSSDSALTALADTALFHQGDRITKTIRYANLIAPAILNSIATNPNALTLSSLRPAANDGDDRVEYKLYDAAARLVKTIDGAGAVVEYHYDGTGQPTDIIQYATELTSDQLTALAAIDGEIDANNTNATVVVDNVNDRHIRNFYDADGLLLGTLSL